MQYFKEQLGENLACEDGQEESEAEWLVRITTQVRKIDGWRVEDETRTARQALSWR